MTFINALLLGILQGLTEFIPVSSTAHLLIGQALLGISSTDSRMFSFTVIIQLGTVLALILFFVERYLDDPAGLLPGDLAQEAI